MPIRFVMPARRALKKDARWYEQREAGLGHQFIGSVRRALQRIVPTRIHFPRKSRLTGGATFAAVRLKSFRTK